MSKHFAAIAYTASVRASQRRHGGRELPAGEGSAGVELGSRELAFVAGRDSFYLATVGETGWPHVQHRGGAAGFLCPLSPATLAFADFSGNRQYVSVGNLEQNNRVALILVDYPNRRRLKILGRVELIDIATVDPEFLAKMKLPAAPGKATPGRVERLFVIGVAAYDWNCSQHITPRFTESEWSARRLSTTETAITKE